MTLTQQRKHVFRDLRPYVCTYRDCLNAEKLYVTRHDWLYHEGQLHQRSWICASNCNWKFQSPHLLKQHMLDCHSGMFAESQISVLIDLCERPADPDERAACPLCGEKSTLRALRIHVASHLEVIALFVLPVKTYEHNTDADSDHAENPREKDNRPDDEKLSSLASFGEDEGFEAHYQDFREFETALQTGEERPLVQVGEWLGDDTNTQGEEYGNVLQMPSCEDSSISYKKAKSQDSLSSLAPSPVLKATKIEEEAAQDDYQIPAFLRQSQASKFIFNILTQAYIMQSV